MLLFDRNLAPSNEKSYNCDAVGINPTLKSAF